MMSNPRPMTPAERARANRQRLQRDVRVRQMPSLMKQAANLAKAAGGVVSDLAHGKQPLAAEDVHAARLAVCLAPCADLDEASGRCAACGCFVKAKTRLASQSCPKGYWPA